MTMSHEPETNETTARLTRLKPRDTRSAKASSATYSRAVGIMRWLLPVLALFGLVLLIVWPMLRAQKLATVIQQNVPNLMVEKLHLTGIDAHNQPYSLTADRALQAGGGKNLIDLERPQGELTLEAGGWLAVRAAQGRLDQAGKKLWMGGAVELFHDDGYRFSSDEANIDWEKNIAWGSQPVLIQGPFGEIQGQGFRFLDGGHIMVITGPATAKLSLQRSGGSDKPSVKESTSR